MVAELTEADAAAAREVIAHTTLRSIDFHEVSARRTPAAPEIPTEGKLSLTIQQRSDDEGFGVRLNAHIVMPIGEVDASVAVEYELVDDFKPAPRALQVFTNEVAVMAVFPYLREAVATISAKVFGAPIQLPIAERGQIAVEVDEI